MSDFSKEQISSMVDACIEAGMSQTEMANYLKGDMSKTPGEVMEDSVIKATQDWEVD